jgi:hypothetical protein
MMRDGHSLRAAFSICINKAIPMHMPLTTSQMAALPDWSTRFARSEDHEDVPSTRQLEIKSWTIGWSLQTAGSAARTAMSQKSTDKMLRMSVIVNLHRKTIAEEDRKLSLHVNQKLASYLQKKLPRWTIPRRCTLRVGKTAETANA